eukprot:4332918-Prymnesium_polylepis.1
MSPPGPRRSSSSRRASVPSASSSPATRDTQDIGDRRGVTTRRSRISGSVPHTVSHRQAVDTRSTQTHNTHNKIGRAGGEISRGSCCARRASAECPGRRQCAEA